MYNVCFCFFHLQQYKISFCTKTCNVVFSLLNDFCDIKGTCFPHLFVGHEKTPDT